MEETVPNTVTNISAVDAVIAKSGEHFGRVLRIMAEGVAFPEENDGTKYHVISHSGDDDLGYLSAADVSYAIYLVKQQGRQVGKITSIIRNGDPKQRPAYSFGWEGWYTYNGQIL